MNQANPTQSFYVKSGVFTGKIFPLPIGTHIFGRESDVKFSIPHGGVSRQHMQVNVEPNGTWIADLDSSNGTFVNGVRISESTWLNPNDEVQLGSAVTLVYMHGQSSGGGDATIKSAPPVQTAATRTVPPAAKKTNRKRACLIAVAVVAVLSLCCIATLVASGYYIINQGGSIQKTVLNLVGMGVGEIGITNLADSQLRAELIRLDTETGDPETFNTIRLESFDIGGIGGIDKGSYELQVTTAGGTPAGGSCFIVIESGDIYELVAVPEGIVIRRESYQATTADDLDFATSPLCRQ